MKMKKILFFSIVQEKKLISENRQIYSLTSTISGASYNECRIPNE